MPKEQPTINSTVRFGGVNYTAGQEEELEAAGMDAASIQRLTERGVISGFGSAKKITEGEADAKESAASGKAKSK